MNLTDAEARVIAIVLQEVAAQDGEDLMGVFLKATGHRVLDGAGIVALSDKLQGVLVGQPCFFCDGAGGYDGQDDCDYCDGTGRFTEQKRLR